MEGGDGQGDLRMGTLGYNEVASVGPEVRQAVRLLAGCQVSPVPRSVVRAQALEQLGVMGVPPVDVVIEAQLAGLRLGDPSRRLPEVGPYGCGQACYLQGI